VGIAVVRKPAKDINKKKKVGGRHLEWSEESLTVHMPSPDFGN